MSPDRLFPFIIAHLRHGLLLLLLAGSSEVRAQTDFLEFDQGYAPEWEQLDQRPTPAWYDAAKFGLFVSWGVYSVPAYAPVRSERPEVGLLDAARYGEWLEADRAATSGLRDFHRRAFGPRTSYVDLARAFRAPHFDPRAWATLFRRSGARYVVFTAKHRDGFALWPAPNSWNWNSVDIGPRRDVVGELAEATRAAGLRFGLYYTLSEWRPPPIASSTDRYVADYIEPHLKDLVIRYQPDVLWIDAPGDRTSSAWRSEEFLAWLYSYSPVRTTVAVNDRWGSETRFRRGGFYTEDRADVRTDSLDYRQLLQKWESRIPMASSFAHNRRENLSDYPDARSLIHTLVDVVSRGGNLLLGVGPTGDGRIPVIQEALLDETGAWLNVHGEAIFGTRPWRAHGEGDAVRYTRKGGAVYVILLEWPGTKLVLEEPNLSVWSTALLLGRNEELDWERDGERVVIHLPELTVDELPGPHAQVVRLTVVN